MATPKKITARKQKILNYVFRLLVSSDRAYATATNLQHIYVHKTLYLGFYCCASICPSLALSHSGIYCHSKPNQTKIDLNGIDRSTIKSTNKEFCFNSIVSIYEYFTIVCVAVRTNSSWCI